MSEYEVILIQSPSKFHLLNFPLTQLDQFKQYYSLNQVQYKPISTEISLTYTASDPSDQLTKEVQFNSHIVHNKTYYTLAKLDQDNMRIYLFPVTNVQQMKPKINQEQSKIEVDVQQSQASELLFQRNKAKMLEQMKQQFKWQTELKSKEQIVDLKQVDFKMQEPSSINQTKQMAQSDYQKYFFM